MGLFLLIIFGLIVWFVLRPALAFRRTYKQMQDRARRFYEQQRPPYRPEQTQPKKKIDPTVGEYVDFTETSGAAARASAPDVTPSEDQITDVSWEDLPPKK